MEAKDLNQSCSMDGKKCSNPHCGKWKPLQDFYTKGLSPSGRQQYESICKDCKALKYAVGGKNKKKTARKINKYKSLNFSELEIEEIHSSEDVLDRKMEDYLSSLAKKLFFNTGD